MEIRIGSLTRDANEARGAALVIDVFRAFTTAAIAFDRGAERITLVAEVEEALEIRRRNPAIADILMGEVDGRRPDGFDYGNSPYEASSVDFAGKSIVQSTRAGRWERRRPARPAVIRYTLRRLWWPERQLAHCWPRTRCRSG